MCPKYEDILELADEAGSGPSGGTSTACLASPRSAPELAWSKAGLLASQQLRQARTLHRAMWQPALE